MPGCGASGFGRSPTPDRPSLGRAAGARYPLAVGAGGVGMGTRQLPRSAPSSKLAVRAVGAGRWRPGGGRFLPGCGASGVGRSPTPDCPSFGRAAGARYPLALSAGLSAWGPVTYPTASALASWLCALWGRLEGTWGGGVSCLGVGRLELGALPRPTARPSGVRPGPVTLRLWVRGVRARGRVTYPTARALTR